MPVAKIHVIEGQYDEPRLQKLSAAIQDALRRTLNVPADDFFQIIQFSLGTGFCTLRRFSA
jgi:hypothetical protein